VTANEDEKFVKINSVGKSSALELFITMTFFRLAFTIFELATYLGLKITWQPPGGRT
jgi:hypothetical protein